MKATSKVMFAMTVLLASIASASAFYNSTTGRFLNRDPLGDVAFFDHYSIGKPEEEQWSLWWESLQPAYTFVGNSPIGSIDALGLDRWHVDVLHSYVVVEVWDKCCKEVIGYKRIEFGPRNPIALIPPFFTGPGKVTITDSSKPSGFNVSHLPSDCRADRILLDWANTMANSPPIYSFWIYNCRHFSAYAQNVGIGD